MLWRPSTNHRGASGPSSRNVPGRLPAPLQQGWRSGRRSGLSDRVMVTGRLRQRSWETPEGDKRLVTELEADEVGASLKWATAKVERASQRGNGERSSGRERQAERGGDFNDPPPF
jgi:hypothetical protein